MVLQRGQARSKVCGLFQAAKDELFGVIFQVDVVGECDLLLEDDRQVELAPYLKRNSANKKLVG